MKRKGETHIRIKAGMNNTALSFTRNMLERVETIADSDIDIFEVHRKTTSSSRKTSPQIGVELEYVFPIRNNRWSIFFEPSFQYFKHTYESIPLYNISSVVTSSGQWLVVGDYPNIKIDYSQIMLPLGVKYHFIFSQSAQLFLNASASYNVLLKPSEAFEMNNPSIQPALEQNRVNMIPAVLVGIGYNYKRYSIELGYHIIKQMLETSDWEVNYKNSVTLSIGYRLK
jgi:hypothetical protein